MKKSAWEGKARRIAYLLGALIALSLVLLAIATQKMIGNVSIPVVDNAILAEYLPEDLPQIERLKDPSAILVLDVSASMKDSDPDHLQTAAVEQFYDVYSALSKEVLRAGEHARLSVILFSSIAQVIEWGDGIGPWIEVREENAPRFKEVVERYLGRPGFEPRKGLDTDYSAALSEVEKMLEEVESPPAIIFMTDGENDPNPMISPIRSNVQGPMPEDNNCAQILHRLSKGEFRFLRGRDSKVFDRRDFGVPSGHLTSAQEVDASRHVREQLGKLIAEHLFHLSEWNSSVPPYWAPVLLGRGSASMEKAMGTLHPNADERLTGFWGKKAAIHCADADVLTSSFLEVLANWFRLRRVEVDKEQGSFTVPDQTQAFAVFVHSPTPLGAPIIVSDNSSLSLNGSGYDWAGVGRGSGRWTVRSGSGQVPDLTVYVRPRYEWVLHVPDRISLGSGDGRRDDKVRIEMYLYSMESYKPVNTFGTYPDLPPSVPGTLRLKGIEPVTRFDLRRNPDNTSLAAYVADVPYHGATRGELWVGIDPSGINRFAGLGDGGMYQKVIRLRPSVKMVLREPLGTAVGGIAIKGVPSTKGWLMEHGGKWLGRD